jgi:hypothetical protein
MVTCHKPARRWRFGDRPSGFLAHRVHRPVVRSLAQGARAKLRSDADHGTELSG